MEEHNLKQSDLPEVGSQGVVSEILSGKRKLNICKIKALSERFGVSPAVFILTYEDKIIHTTPLRQYRYRLVKSIPFL
jgi:transcriptional regulator with XRE-family HTH domain